MDECKLLSEPLYTELAHIFGQSLDLMDLTFCRLHSSLKISFSALFVALGVNNSLTSLDLCNNCINDEGANSLSEALRDPSLTSLNLSWNFIEEEGAKSLSSSQP